MIVSDRQLGVSVNQLKKLEDALEQLRANASENDALRDIEIAALLSQIEDLRLEVAEYEILKSGSFVLSESFSLSDLPRALVQARILKGWSQTELAERLGLKPQQVQRYEATDYMSASLSRLIEVAAALDVKVSESFGPSSAGGNALLTWRDERALEWTKFPLKEMARRGWIGGSDLAAAAGEWFRAIAGPSLSAALHRKKVRGGSRADEYALLAWQARVLQLAEDAIKSKPHKAFELDERWLPELVRLTRDPDGPWKARDLLADRGIAMVIARHLPGTYLDGAAMTAPSGTPVIALTLRYDRLDNFWFVLFHELGHVFLHLHDNLRLDFFDEEGDGALDPIEHAADRFALNALISDEQWNTCVSRFARSTQAVEVDAKRLGVGPSIIAGRIRKELNDYTVLNDAVGIGLVRACFPGEQS
jgi:HTH-type transcriptional regulator/antitoxin HigA